VRASYNGATGVARWALLAGPDAGHLERVATARSTGFETTLRTSAERPYVAVRALDADGRTLGTSKPVKVG
jgi:hypothetical protein